jgi:hypothetical protein
VRSWLDVPTFATRRLHAYHHTRAPSGGRWNFGREMSGNFVQMLIYMVETRSSGCVKYAVHLNGCLHFYVIWTQQGCRVLKNVHNFICEPQPIILIETGLFANSLSCSGVLAIGTKVWFRTPISVGTTIFEFCTLSEARHKLSERYVMYFYFPHWDISLTCREMGDGIAVRCKVFVRWTIKLLLSAK